MDVISWVALGLFLYCAVSVIVALFLGRVLRQRSAYYPPLELVRSSDESEEV